MKYDKLNQFNLYMLFVDEININKFNPYSLVILI